MKRKLYSESAENPQGPRQSPWPKKKPAEPDLHNPKSWVLYETLMRLGQNAIAERDTVNVLGKSFHASGKVFSPKFSLEDTEIFAQNLPVRPGAVMLEIGTGTGILAIFACYRGASRVVAIDINWKAVANARANVVLHNMADRIFVRKGDVYSSVRKGERFDTIFWNVPFVFAKSEDVRRELMRLQNDVADNPTMKSALERLPYELSRLDLSSGSSHYFLWAAYIDNDYRSIRRFINGARSRLNSGGKALVCFSSTYGEMELLQELAEKAQMDSRIVFEQENSRGVMLEIIEMRPR
ncbi:MAG: class I SAM-dependent methyltransferase [Candidatus Bilamarchaeaceae archaeon]